MDGAACTASGGTTTRKWSPLASALLAAMTPGGRPRTPRKPSSLSAPSAWTCCWSRSWVSFGGCQVSQKSLLLRLGELRLPRRGSPLQVAFFHSWRSNCACSCVWGGGGGQGRGNAFGSWASTGRRDGQLHAPTRPTPNNNQSLSDPAPASALRLPALTLPSHTPPRPQLSWCAQAHAATTSAAGALSGGGK